MGTFSVEAEKQGFKLKLWRGERTCLLGMDVLAPEPDFVGFSIEVKAPGAADFVPLNNRLAFSYPAGQGANGFKLYPSTQAPFQKFRWLHFPWDHKPGSYQYRVTKLHMDAAGNLKAGAQNTAAINLDPSVYGGSLDVGFTRNFASSQAYAERYHNDSKTIPGNGDDPLQFKKVNDDRYAWMGFEAYDLIFGLLNEAVNDPTITLDVLAYDLNEPDVVERLRSLGKRLHIVIDNSGSHGDADSPETQAAQMFNVSAGVNQVRRTKFLGLQHHKVLIAKKNGVPYKVLLGSTNFSYRGLYIQANNVLVFTGPEVAGLFGQVFTEAFERPTQFPEHPLAKQWHTINLPGHAPLQFCFSPHANTALSLDPLGTAIDGASSSVLYSIAFLNQIASGPTHDSIDRLQHRDLFSYGVVNKDTGMSLKKPDGSLGIVDFAYLAKHAPPPFSTEWGGGAGINIHNKFVVTDFDKPTAQVFTGSSNLSPSGEAKNGDNLVLIQDQEVAVAYAIEAVRLFDHLQFRTVMQAKTPPGTVLAPITLKKPSAQSGAPAWFEPAYVANSQRQKDRQLFAGTEG